MSTRLERFRHHKDDFFRTSPDSPLTPEQQARFTALAYYPERPDLHFELKLDRDGVDTEVVELDTTDGERKPFRPAGTFTVPIDGQNVTLIVYKQPERGRYFLPFRDATSGTETYEIGRYLDPQEAPDGTLTVDFNYAYNPYCAYGEGWSCPIPPAANQVSVPIRAGEKNFELPEA
jgi:uncharacterized protein (DUF1684 family)